MSNLARKQNCFDDMFVYRYTESLEVDIYDYNSYFKMYNLLPAISHSSWYLSYSYDRRENFWRINASWEDEGAILGFEFSPDIKLVYQTFKLIYKE